MGLAHAAVGTGSPLVLIHGLTENRTMWDPLVDRFADHRHVITLDLPGHGETGLTGGYDAFSMVGAVVESLAELGIETPILVGHSLGATVATLAATAMPVRGVVNVDQPLALGEFGSQVKAMEPQLRGGPATCETAVTELLTEMTGALSSDARARIEALRNPVQDVILGVWSLLLDSDPAELDALTLDVLSGIEAPYLAIHGIAPGDGYESWLAAALPQAQVEVWPDLGHYPHLVEADRFVDRVHAFATQVGG